MPADLLAWSPFMVQVGVGTASAQCLLASLFSVLPHPWSKQPGFLAHQLVALALVSYMAWVGCTQWGRMETADTPEARVFGQHPVGSHLSQLTVAQLICWDIPTGLLAPSMRVHGYGQMAAHHVAMLAMAYLGMSMLGHYGVYYLGVVELSSIPLQVVAVCCPSIGSPRRTPTPTPEPDPNPGRQVVDIFRPGHLNELTTLSPALNGLNELARVLFALLFIIVRALHFPYAVPPHTHTHSPSHPTPPPHSPRLPPAHLASTRYISFGSVLPDVFYLLGKPGLESGERLTLHAIWFCNLSLTLLQLYWASLIAQQLLKMLRGTPKAEKSRRD